MDESLSVCMIGVSYDACNPMMMWQTSFLVGCYDSQFFHKGLGPA